MSEYQQKPNTGNVFQPRPDQSLILTGKLDIDGEKKHVALMKDTTAQGKPVIFILERVGFMMKNENATEENNQPAYRGSFSDETKELSAWYQTSQKGNKYLSMKVQEPYKKEAVNDDEPENKFSNLKVEEEVSVGDIPF